MRCVAWHAASLLVVSFVEQTAGFAIFCPIRASHNQPATKGRFVTVLDARHHRGASRDGGVPLSTHESQSARPIVKPTRRALRLAALLLAGLAKPVWAATAEGYAGGLGSAVRAFGWGALLFLVVQSARLRSRSSPAKLAAEQWRDRQRVVEPTAPVALAQAVEAVPPPPPPPKPVLTPSQEAALKIKPAATARGGALSGLFSRKKTDRAVNLQEVLENQDAAGWQFATGLAGCLLAELEPAVRTLIMPADAVERLTAPWLLRAQDARDLRAARAYSAWQQTGRAVSFVDFGLPLTQAARETLPNENSQYASRWRDVCDANNIVVSHFDFGVRETDISAKIDAQRFDAVAKSITELAQQQIGTTGDQLAEVFANVVNAMLVPLVDAAVSTLKLGDDAASLPPLKQVADLAQRTAALFDELGLPPLPKPVVYEGRATRAQLASLFSRYAAAAVALGLDNDTQPSARVDVAAVDVLQAIFGISEKRAKKLADQVVAKLVTQMLEASDPAANPDLASLLDTGDNAKPPSNAEIDAQLDGLKQAIESGQLSDADKKEIKSMFQSMLGGQDVKAALDAAQQNSDKLDPRSKKALDLLKQIV